MSFLNPLSERDIRRVNKRTDAAWSHKLNNCSTMVISRPLTCTRDQLQVVLRGTTDVIIADSVLADENLAERWIDFHATNLGNRMSRMGIDTIHVTGNTASRRNANSAVRWFRHGFLTDVESDDDVPRFEVSFRPDSDNLHFIDVMHIEYSTFRLINLGTILHKFEHGQTHAGIPGTGLPHHVLTLCIRLPPADDNFDGFAKLASDLQDRDAIGGHGKFGYGYGLNVMPQPEYRMIECVSLIPDIAPDPPSRQTLTAVERNAFMRDMKCPLKGTQLTIRTDAKFDQDGKWYERTQECRELFVGVGFEWTNGKARCPPFPAQSSLKRANSSSLSNQGNKRQCLPLPLTRFEIEEAEHN